MLGESGDGGQDVDESGRDQYPSRGALAAVAQREDEP